MRYVFGPVPSRRLGNSLGVDLVTLKACTFDCVYCQLGRTTEQTCERRSFVPADAVVAEVREALASAAEVDARGASPCRQAAVDYVTLSGSGEPTLSLDLGRVIRAIKGLTPIPVAVLTNGSLLGRADVQADLADSDLVIPSLDAGTQAAFERVNRPRGLSVAEVARGIRDFSLAYGGAVWLEVMIVAGINDTPDEALAIVRLLEGGRFDKVQLNTVVRAPAEPWAAGAVAEERLEALAAILAALAPVETIGQYRREGHEARHRDAEESVLAALARRPCGAAELAASLGLAPALVVKLIDEMTRAGKLERIVVGPAVQYRAR